MPNNVSEIRFADITQNVGGVSQVLFTAAQQATITTYREALRNLPAQPGFPLEVTIPPAPMV